MKRPRGRGAMVVAAIATVAVGGGLLVAAVVLVVTIFVLPPLDTAHPCDQSTVSALSASGEVDALRQRLTEPDSGDRQSLENGRALQCAVDEDHVEVAALLLASGAEPDAIDSRGAMSPLLTAVEARSTAMVEVLLDGGVRRESAAALGRAASNGEVEMVRDLLDHDVDPAGGETAGYGEGENDPLLLALFFGRSDVVDLLLAAGADPSHGRLPANALLAAIVLEPGLDDRLPGWVDAMNEQAEAVDISPLAVAVVRRDAFAVHELFEAGADPNIRSLDDYTALDVAAIDCNGVVARQIIERGGKLAAVSYTGRPACGDAYDVLVEAGLL